MSSVNRTVPVKFIRSTTSQGRLMESLRPRRHSVGATSEGRQPLGGGHHDVNASATMPGVGTERATATRLHESRADRASKLISSRGNGRRAAAPSRGTRSRQPHRRFSSGGRRRASEDFSFAPYAPMMMFNTAAAGGGSTTNSVGHPRPRRASAPPASPRASAATVNIMVAAAKAAAKATAAAQADVDIAGAGPTLEQCLVLPSGLPLEDGRGGDDGGGARRAGVDGGGGGGGGAHVDHRAILSNYSMVTKGGTGGRTQERKRTTAAGNSAVAVDANGARTLPGRKHSMMSLDDSTSNDNSSGQEEGGGGGVIEKETTGRPAPSDPDRQRAPAHGGGFVKSDYLETEAGPDDGNPGVAARGDGAGTAPVERNDSAAAPGDYGTLTRYPSAPDLALIGSSDDSSDDHEGDSPPRLAPVRDSGRAAGDGALVEVEDGAQRDGGKRRAQQRARVSRGKAERDGGDKEGRGKEHGAVEAGLDGSGGGVSSPRELDVFGSVDWAAVAAEGGVAGGGGILDTTAASDKSTAQDLDATRAPSEARTSQFGSEVAAVASDFSEQQNLDGCGSGHEDWETVSEGDFSYGSEAASGYDQRAEECGWPVHRLLSVPINNTITEVGPITAVSPATADDSDDGLDAEGMREEQSEERRARASISARKREAGSGGGDTAAATTKRVNWRLRAGLSSTSSELPPRKEPPSPADAGRPGRDHTGVASSRGKTPRATTAAPPPDQSVAEPPPRVGGSGSSGERRVVVKEPGLASVIERGTRGAPSTGKNGDVRGRVGEERGGGAVAVDSGKGGTGDDDDGRGVAVSCGCVLM